MILTALAPARSFVRCAPSAASRSRAAAARAAAGVLLATAKSPTHLECLPNDLPKLTRFLDRLARAGELHVCYEAGAAGYVLHRALRSGATPAT